MECKSSLAVGDQEWICLSLPACGEPKSYHTKVLHGITANSTHPGEGFRIWREYLPSDTRHLGSDARQCTHCHLSAMMAPIGTDSKIYVGVCKNTALFFSLNEDIFRWEKEDLIMWVLRGECWNHPGSHLLFCFVTFWFEVT